MSPTRKSFARVLIALSLLVPALPGGVGAIQVPGASPNVEILAQIPDVQFMGARIVGRFLYATGTSGLRIYDLVNPELPLLVGALPLQIFSNEDVAVSAFRKLVLISNDNTGSGFGGGLFIVDVANPATPVLKSVISYNAKFGFDGVGHIANCIADCARYAYITGADGGKILILDIADPANPVVVKFFSTTAGGARTGSTFKTVHDVNTDPSGGVWVTGTGGIVKLNVSNPTFPTETIKTTTAQNDANNQFVYHNSLLMPDQTTLLVTEEDWANVNCKTTTNLQRRPEGSFQTWQVTGATPPLALRDTWATELEQSRFVDGGTPISAFCSSHWFDFNANKVVAVAWYQQGVRFLNVSNPMDIRQVGYYLPPWEAGGLGVSMTLFAPGRNDIVYAMSLTSGLVVLRIANGGAGAPTVTAPIMAEWVRPPSAVSFARFKAHPTLGLACALPA